MIIEALHVREFTGTLGNKVRLSYVLIIDVECESVAVVG
jgi:hypothetical protein